MKKATFILLFILVCSHLINAQQLNWVNTFNNTGIDALHLSSIVKDDDGNVYATGTVKGTLNFGNEYTANNINGGSDNKAFIGKYNAAGNLVWIHLLSKPVNKYHLAVHSDYVYLSGVYNDSTLVSTIDSNTYIHGGKNNVFLAKYDLNGKLVTTKNIAHNPTITNAELTGIQFIEGNLYVGGIINGHVNFNPDTAVYDTFTTNYNQLFLSKYNTSGVLLKAAVFGKNLGDLEVYDIDFGSIPTEIIVAGRASDSADMNPITATPMGKQSNFIIKYDTGFGFKWLTEVTASTPPFNNIDNIIRDHSGNIYIKGYYQGSTTLDAGNNALVLPNVANTEYYVAKINNSGRAVWAKPLLEHKGNVEVNHIHYLEEKNTLLLVGAYSDSFNVGNPYYLTTKVNSTNIFLAEYDTGFNLNKANSVGDSGVIELRNSFNIGGGRIIVNGYLNNSAVADLDFSKANHMLHLRDHFLADYDYTFNTVRGRVYIDANNNNQYDAGERFFNNGLVNGNYSSSDSGVYTAYVDEGVYTFEMNNIPYYSASPNTINVNFSSIDSTSSNNDFKLTPITGIKDVRVSLINLGNARPGFKSTFIIQYENVGTDTLSGEVKLYQDASLNLLSSQPNYTSSSADSVTWSYSNLIPGEQRRIVVEDSMDLDLSLIDKYITSKVVALVINDTTPTDNTDSIQLLVTNSYIPNYKHVSHIGNLSPYHKDEWIKYTVGFQNTSDDTAYNVFVSDKLNKHLNWSYFEMLGHSHPLTYHINANGLLECFFDNINLPDSNTNYTNSKGYFTYRIKLKDTIPYNDTIKNRANIYFDSTPPAVTNTTQNRFVTDIMVEIVNNPFYQVCAGSTLEYTCTTKLTLDTSNWLIVYISDSSGDFANEIVLDSFKTTVIDSIFTSRVPNHLYGEHYRLRVKCTSPDLVSIPSDQVLYIKYNPNISFTTNLPSNGIICQQGSFKMQASPGRNTYRFYQNNTLIKQSNDSFHSVLHPSPGYHSFYIMVLDKGCHVQTDTFNITVHNNPNTKLVVDDTKKYCPDDTVFFKFSGADSFRLSSYSPNYTTLDSVGVPALRYEPLANVSIMGKNTDGCTYPSNGYRLDIVPKVRTFLSDRRCEGEDMTLKLQPLFQNNVIDTFQYVVDDSIYVFKTNSKEFTYPNISLGEHYFKVNLFQLAHGCDVTPDTIRFNVTPYPKLRVTLGRDDNCSTDTVTMKIHGGNTYRYYISGVRQWNLWQPIYELKVPNPKPTDYFYVEGLQTGGYCPAFSDTIWLADWKPEVEITDYTEAMCNDDTMLVRVKNADAFEWYVDNNLYQKFASDDSLYIYGIPEGNHKLIINGQPDNPNCILKSDTVEFKIKDKNFTHQPDTHLCYPDKLHIVADSGWDTYLWKPENKKTQEVYLSPFINLEYTLDMSLNNGCKVSDTFDVRVTHPAKSSFFLTEEYGGKVITHNSSNNTTNYLWDWGDSSPNDTSFEPTHVFAENKTYTVTLTVENECGEDDYSSNFNVTKVSVSVVKGNNINAYPNPTSGVVYIDISDHNDYNFKITNQLGQILPVNYRVQDGKVEFDLSYLAKGVYYIDVIDSNTGEISKVKIVKYL